MSRHSVFDSFLSPTEYSSQQCAGESDVIGSEVVALRRLDAIFDSCVDGVKNPRVFLKIDTQGYDFEVLAGIGRALGWIVGLQTELSVKPIYAGLINYL